MRTKVFVTWVGLVLFGTSSAEAHFKLAEPADRLQTDDNGDPLGTDGLSRKRRRRASAASVNESGQPDAEPERRRVGTAARAHRNRDGQVDGQAPVDEE